MSEYYVFSYDGISAFQLTHGLLPGFNGSWQLTKQELDMISKGCFTKMGELIQDAGLTEFQRRLRSSLLTYTKGLSIPSIGDRLVFTFSSVEMLFLRDASEPIQQNVGERMAFLTEHSAEKRRSVVESVKKAYQLRSRYVHHGLDVEDRGELESFQRSAFYAFFNALKATKKFEKHSDFLSRLDQIKYGS